MSDEDDNDDGDSSEFMKKFLELQTKLLAKEFKFEKGFIIEISGEDLKTQIGQHILKIRKHIDELKQIKTTKSNVALNCFNNQEVLNAGPILLRPCVAKFKIMEAHCENLIEFAKRTDVKKLYKIHFTEWLQLFDRVDFHNLESFE